jgi:hypothetical protein
MKRVEKKRWFKRKCLIVVGIILLLIILFFVTKSYLYFRYLIGNDFVISLNADKTNFFLNHNEEDKVIFESQIYTNFFCSANCHSKFIDLSSGKTLDEKKFYLKPAMQNIQEFYIYSDKFGSGQDLYRFEIKCTSIKTAFCKTSGEEKSKNILITLDYDLNEEEKILKQKYKENISFGITEINYLENYLSEFKNISLKLSEFNNSINFSEEIENVSKSINLLNESYFNLKKDWENNNYLFLEKEIYNSEEGLIVLKKNFDLLNNAIQELVLENNYLFDNLTYAREKLEEFKNKNVSFNETLEINSLIMEFNEIIEDKINYSEIYQFISKIENILFEEEPCCFASEKINNFNLSKIYFIEIKNNFSINFSEPASNCCFLGNCSSCWNSHPNLNYPIVFVHGHSFNHKVSAEYSFDTFEDLQEKLEEEGYINAGTIISVSREEKIFGKLNYPMSFVASYYFDIYKNDESTKIIQTKQDSIDTYAIRLNEIIKEIKSETGKNKVIIVCHSMGGIVSRRYLQIFGEESVDKIIILGTPNHGISEKIYDYCKLFGSSRECDDMKSDSLLINKLKQDVLEIPVYNIIGVGCDMGGEDGDGIVENKTAYLSYAKNYYVNGTCPNTFKFLHLDFVYPDKYPEVYEIIKEALRE